MATPRRTERLQVEIDREMLKTVEDFDFGRNLE